jgi:hypothetical protein
MAYGYLFTEQVLVMKRFATCLMLYSRFSTLKICGVFQRYTAYNSGMSLVVRGPGFDSRRYQFF